MLKNIEKKKIILIVLIIILIVISLKVYSQNNNFDLFNPFAKSKNNEEILFKNESEIKENTVQSPKSGFEKDVKVKEKVKSDILKQQKIKQIAVIKDLKDPFQENKNKEKNKLNLSKEENNNLLALENNIIAQDLSLKTTKAFNNKADNNNKADDNNNTTNTKQKKVRENEIKEKNKITKNISQLKLPFKLLGIVKQKDNSAALFLYKNEKILVKEDEKINLFKIKKIKNNRIIISLNNQKRVIKLWEEENNEN